MNTLLGLFSGSGKGTVKVQGAEALTSYKSAFADTVLSI